MWVVWVVWAVWAVGGGQREMWAYTTCAARKLRMPSERTLGEAERDRIPASASVQGLSVCMNGKALDDELFCVRVVTQNVTSFPLKLMGFDKCFDVTFDIDIDETYRQIRKKKKKNSRRTLSHI